MKFLTFALLSLLWCSAPSWAQDSAFAWLNEEGQHIDLLHDGTKLVRYVYERMDPDNREATYKPFHHVYDPAGESFLTKGPGGKYTHHRGVYYGFSKCRFVAPDGSNASIDTWHCKRGYQTHEEVLESTASANSAMHRVLIFWRMDDGFVFLKEERQMEFTPLNPGVQIDFTSTVTTELDEVILDGDPQHAGFQFRAANEVFESTAAQTYYVRPKTGKSEPGKFLNWSKNDEDERVTNLPWKAMSFVVGGKRYTTLYLDHPDNPKPARYSERNYGRFGSYFVATVKPDQPLTVRYRLRVQPGELTMEDCDAQHSAWVAN